MGLVTASLKKKRTICRPEHADRQHIARGMCNACYATWYYYHVERINKGLSAVPHPLDTPTKAHMVLKKQLEADNWFEYFPGAFCRRQTELPGRCTHKSCEGLIVLIDFGGICFTCGRTYTSAEAIVRELLLGRDSAVDEDED